MQSRPSTCLLTDRGSHKPLLTCSVKKQEKKQRCPSTKEIISIYPALSPPTLTTDASNRLCNAFAFLQVDDPEVISFLLQTDIIPLCLQAMEMGSELSKTVATFIVQKILLDDDGLQHICAKAERFFSIGTVLANMVVSVAEQPFTKLLKHIIRCYLRLSDNPRACDALQNCLPEMLKDRTFNNCLRDDPTTRGWLQQLLHNISRANLGFIPHPSTLELTLTLGS